ncbi:hypothetical protein EYF80_037055 [Liparis tanakae]|uniref:Uncharacterized protein n=1 Tax=Liparis tanakae TaxID=230148 RepID=A0A4Z2GHS4_9TELE|nr:hypothetical protein EYF80_037055 [Liparis tanakae]
MTLCRVTSVHIVTCGNGGAGGGGRHRGRCKSEGRGGEKPEPRAKGVRRGDIKVGTLLSGSRAIAVIIKECGRQRQEEMMMRHGMKEEGLAAGLGVTIIPQTFTAPLRFGLTTALRDKTLLCEVNCNTGGANARLHRTFSNASGLILKPPDSIHKTREQALPVDGCLRRVDRCVICDFGTGVWQRRYVGQLPCWYSCVPLMKKLELLKRYKIIFKAHAICVTDETQVNNRVRLSSDISAVMYSKVH